LLLQNRYRVIKQIGKGGFCKTELALDEGKCPPVSCVIQQVYPQHLKSETFNKKVKLLKELGSHPQIPSLLDNFIEGDRFYLVEEFIDGNNLAEQLEIEGASSEIQIWQLLEYLLPVIQFIHAHNLIHCHIKPESIIHRSTSSYPDKKGELVLVDFYGFKIATEISFSQFHPTGEIDVGSPEYMAPEQAQGKVVFASDLYSLGVTCIYLLTHIPPFDLFDVASDSWVWQDYLTHKVSDRLTQILNKLIQKPISLRFQNAAEVMQALGTYSSFGYPSLLPINRHTTPLTLSSSNSSTSSIINSIAISPNGNILASGYEDKTIKLWDLNTKQPLGSLWGHSQGVKSVCFSPDGKTLASASDDKTIKLWDVQTSQEVLTLTGHSHAVKSVAFSPRGLLASGSWDKTVKLWELNTGKEIYTFTGHQLQVSAIAFSPIGQFLASASFDRTICLWKLPLTGEYEGVFKNRPQYTLVGHAWAVLTVAFSPDGRILATGSDDNTIKLWEVNTGQLLHTFTGHSWSVVALAFSADGTTLISGSWDRTVKLWDLNTTEEIESFSGHADSVTTIAVSPDAQLIASGSRDKNIKLWEFGQQQES
jgi:serine/threonine protein kinase